MDRAKSSVRAVSLRLQWHLALASVIIDQPTVQLHCVCVFLGCKDALMVQCLIGHAYIALPAFRASFGPVTVPSS